MLHYSKQLHIKHKDQVVTEAEACFPQFRLLTSSAIGSAMSSVIGHLNQQLDWCVTSWPGVHAHLSLSVVVNMLSICSAWVTSARRIVISEVSFVWISVVCMVACVFGNNVQPGCLKKSKVVIRDFVRSQSVRKLLRGMHYTYPTTSSPAPHKLSKNVYSILLIIFIYYFHVLFVCWKAATV